MKIEFFLNSFKVNQMMIFFVSLSSDLNVKK